MFNKLFKLKHNKRKYTTDTVIVNNKPSKLLKYVKISVATYVVCSTFSFVTAMYNEGKEALNIRRNIRKNNPEYSDIEDDDWILLKQTLENTAAENAFKSVILPLGFVKNIFPNIVLWLNPNDE